MKPNAADVIPESELRKIGETLQAEGLPWHMHMFSPGCILNGRPDANAIFLEDTARGRSYVTYSPTPLVETARYLAELVHGKEATAPPASDESDPRCSVVGAMVVRAKELMARGRHWHHHIFFPSCVFNPQPGNWTMIFEDPDTGEVLTSSSKDHPAHDIGITERLYYSQRF